MLIYDPHFREHRPWARACAIGTLAAVAAFSAVAVFQGGLPGGGSVIGLVFGGAAFLLFLFECALAARKWVRWRLGPVRVWMRAHIWLGLFCVPLVLLHAGGPRVPRGWLPVTLEVLFFAVIGSGVWLLYRQNRLPRQIRIEVPKETIAAQIDAVMWIRAAVLARRIDDVCGLPDSGRLASEVVASQMPAELTRDTDTPARGAAEPPATHVPGAEELRRFFIAHACDYLLKGRAGRSRLQSETDALFDELEAVPEAAQPVVTELKELCDLRREFDHQKELDAKLHFLRFLHIPLSVLLVFLTVVHAITALRYW